MSRSRRRSRSAALALVAGAALAATAIAPARAATDAPALQGSVRTGATTASVVMTITPAGLEFPDSATIDMVATYGYRTWQPRTGATCPGASPFDAVSAAAPHVVAAWCIYTPNEAPATGAWVPKGIATFPHAGRTYLVVNQPDATAQLTLTRQPKGGQPARVADIGLMLPNGAPIRNHGGGIAVAGTKLYLADGTHLRVFDLMKIGANRDSYAMLQERVYTSTQNLFTSLAYDTVSRLLVATSYGVTTTDRPITFWAVATNGYLTAPSRTIRPVRTTYTPTTQITGVWSHAGRYVLSTAQTSTGRLFASDITSTRAPRAFAWVDEPAGLAEWSDTLLVSTTQPTMTTVGGTVRTEATLFVFARP